MHYLIFRKYGGILFLTASLLLLTACGGGGGGNGDNSGNSPDSFSFSDQTDVTLETIITSDSITISGLDEAATISITGGEYSIDSGIFTDVEGSVENGQTVTIRLTSSNSVSTTTEAILTISDISDTFSVTTQSVDTTPDSFSFTDQQNVALDVQALSNSILISDIAADAPISISDGEYSIDGGSFTNAIGTISNGQSVIVRQTTSEFPMTLTSSSLSVGGVSNTFNTTTGDIGTGFNKARGFDRTVHDLAYTDDNSGDFYAAGSFTTYNSQSANSLIRLNDDGSADPVLDIGSGFDNQVRVILTLDDDSSRLYAGGIFNTYNGTTANHIIRLNEDGTIDTTFSVGSAFDGNVLSITLAPDGSGDIYVGGGFTMFNGTNVNGLVRLNADGSLDTAFNIGTGFDGDVWSIVAADDVSGDIYVGGEFSSYDSNSSNRIIRLNNVGSLVGSFAIGTGFDNTVYAISSAGDGSNDIYVGGRFTSYGATSANRIIRLSDSGSISISFNSGTGIPTGTVWDIQIVPDGSFDLLISGSFTSYNGQFSSRLVRVNNDGSVDTSLMVGDGFDNTVWAQLISPDNSQIYLSGSFNRYDNQGRNGLVRLDMEGTIDSQFVFGTGLLGETSTIVATDDNSGNMYIGGDFFFYNGVETGSILRLHDDGDIDESFISGSGFDDSVSTIAKAPDSSGDIYVGGSFSSYNGTVANRIIRLNSNGTVDATFNYGSGFNNGVNHISTATDGSDDIYVAGSFSTYNGSSINQLVRLNSDGSIDSQFNTGTGFDDRVRAVEPATDGSGDVYVVGDFSTYDGSAASRIIRLDNEGSKVNSFNYGTGFNRDVYTIKMAEDGSNDIYVGGNFSDYNGNAIDFLARINADGSFDSDFITGSVIDDRVWAIVVIPDSPTGDIYVGGGFLTVNGLIIPHVVRLQNDGDVFSGFDIGTGFDDDIFAIGLTNDGTGDLIVGGETEKYNNTTINGIVRLDADGTVD